LLFVASTSTSRYSLSRALLYLAFTFISRSALVLCSRVILSSTKPLHALDSSMWFASARSLALLLHSSCSIYFFSRTALSRALFFLAFCSITIFVSHSVSHSFFFISRSAVGSRIMLYLTRSHYTRSILPLCSASPTLLLLSLCSFVHPAQSPLFFLSRTAFSRFAPYFHPTFLYFFAALFFLVFNKKNLWTQAIRSLSRSANFALYYFSVSDFSPSLLFVVIYSCTLLKRPR
jgi:hypothetical protein